MIDDNGGIKTLADCLEKLYLLNLNIEIGNYYLFFPDEGDINGPDEMIVYGDGCYKVSEVIDQNNLVTTLSPMLDEIVTERGAKMAKEFNENGLQKSQIDSLKGGTTYHVCLCIEGSLRQSNKRLDGILSSEGVDMTGDQVKSYLRKMRNDHDYTHFSGCDNMNSIGKCAGHKSN